MTDWDFSKYGKLTDKELILKNPDTYCGCVAPKTETIYILEELNNGIPVLKEKEITRVPGLCNLCDELFVNACDRIQVDNTCNTVKVEWSMKEGWISVYNNGTGIPVVEHPEYKCLIPELIFGQLRTSTNYKKDSDSTVGGRNGLGAKLCNVLGSKFELETSNSESGQRYVGTWCDNMSKYKHKLFKSAKNDFTKVTFWPDWKRFQDIDGWNDDHLAWLGKRVVDMAGTVHSRAKIYLNKVRVDVRNFKSYVNLYVEDPKSVVYDDIHPRWSIAVTTSPTAEFRHVSFANNINTGIGGSHVELLMKQLVRKLLDILRKKNPNVKITHSMIRQRIWIFVNSFIACPSFTSQTKEEVGSKPEDLGSTPEIPDSFIKKILSKKILDSALEFATFSQSKSMKKTDGKKKTTVTGIPKLDDANKAGGRESQKCTLILTEGDSAKALAMSGLTVVGRDYYGVFPLKGKPLNVREASQKTLASNVEVNSLKQILGLKHGFKYEDTSSLRYGRVMIMADADDDGSHIKGLVMNIFHYMWPELYRMSGFLCEFITPVVRCTKGKNECIDFYTQPEFRKWYGESDRKSWKVKYYKGLGTSTAKDAKKYFTALDRHVIKFTFDHESDADNECMLLAFDNSLADRRKEWLNRDTGELMDTNVDSIRYSDFVDKELVLFSRTNVERAIPSILDGLKPSQRKILYTAVKKNMIKNEKVCDFSSNVSRFVGYHHGESSLHQTVISMAQDYVGSNNIGYLVNDGQFGTRSLGGKDAASPRYMFTNMNNLTPLIFPMEDLPLLDYLEDDGKVVEPKYMVSVVPMVLCNGASGIGTGWSTNIPAYNPVDIVKNIACLMTGKPMERMTPWYRGFSGTITAINPHKYKVCGRVTKVSSTEVDILELPVGKWTQSYKEHLQKMIESMRIVRFTEHHTEHEVHFRVHLAPEKMLDAEKDLITYFKLFNYITTSNMVLFDSNQVLKRYENELDIMKEYYDSRLRYYNLRRENMIKVAEEEINNISWKVKFIQLVVNGDIELRNQKKIDIESHLEKHDIPHIYWAPFFRMSISSITMEEVSRLYSQQEELKEKLKSIIDTSAKKLWREDINKFLAVYLQHEKARETEYQKGREDALKLMKNSQQKIPMKRKKKSFVGKSTSSALVMKRKKVLQ